MTFRLKIFKLLSLNPEFKRTDFGQKAGRFLEELYRHQSNFPIAIGRAAILLCFLTETIGTKSIIGRAAILLCFLTETIGTKSIRGKCCLMKEDPGG